MRSRNGVFSEGFAANRTGASLVIESLQGGGGIQKGFPRPRDVSPTLGLAREGRPRS